MSNDADQKPRDWQTDYDSAMYEISEIVRVARDNPAGLREFLQLNFPREWGLSKEEHRAILDGASKGQPDAAAVDLRRVRS